MLDSGFNGFFWAYLVQRNDLEYLLFHFYKQLLKKLDFYEKYKQEIVLSGTGPVRVTLKESHMTLERSPPPEHVHDTPVDFLIFRGDYMKVFQEGTVLFNILRVILHSHGQTAEMAALKAKHDSYKESLRHSTKVNTSLRAFCWYLDKYFVSHFPTEFRVAFTMDCLLFSEWRISHPNLVGLHMLALAWMMNVKEFHRFLPDGLRDCSVIAKPPYAKFLEIRRISVSIGKPPKTTQHRVRSNDAKTTDVEAAV